MIASDVWIWSNSDVYSFENPKFVLSDLFIVRVCGSYVCASTIYLFGCWFVPSNFKNNRKYAGSIFCIDSHDDHRKGFWRVDVEKFCLEKLRFEKNSIHVNKISCETFFSIKAHQQYYFETEVRHFLKYVKYLDSIERVLSCSMISWSNHNWFSSYLTRTKPIYIILSFLYLCNQSRRL